MNTILIILMLSVTPDSTVIAQPDSATITKLTSKLNEDVFKLNPDQFRLDLRESLRKNRQDFELEYQEELWLLKARMDLLDCKMLELKGMLGRQ